MGSEVPCQHYYYVAIPVLSDTSENVGCRNGHMLASLGNKYRISKPVCDVCVPLIFQELVMLTDV